jgi:hypothetical protein
VYLLTSEEHVLKCVYGQGIFNSSPTFLNINLISLSEPSSPQHTSDIHSENQARNIHTTLATIQNDFPQMPPRCNDHSTAGTGQTSTSPKLVTMGLNTSKTGMSFTLILTQIVTVKPRRTSFKKRRHKCKYTERVDSLGQTGPRDEE